MTSFNSGVQPQNRTPQSIGFLLLDNFTLISLASAVEPLRMANQLAGRELYRWTTLSADGGQVWASDGLKISPDASMYKAVKLDMVVVCGGLSIQRSVTPEHVQWLQAQARQPCRLGALCTGSWALAHAGLLDGFDCSVHWECLASIQESFPRVAMSTRLFTLDRDRLTCAGGTAPLDMMLQLISREHGRELSAEISQAFVHERTRNEQNHQRVPLKHMLGTHQPKLQEIVVLMEANLEEPIDLDALAVYAAVSRRQLERLFQKYLQCSPSRYYLKLRLAQARQLLKQTPMSIIDVAAKCGFVSTPHFSKCYREYFGLAPRDERMGCQADRKTQQVPASQPLPMAAPALNQARYESIATRVDGQSSQRLKPPVGVLSSASAAPCNA